MDMQIGFLYKISYCFELSVLTLKKLSLIKWTTWPNPNYREKFISSKVLFPLSALMTFFICLTP